jgi:hypothetical protein
MLGADLMQDGIRVATVTIAGQSQGGQGRHEEVLPAMQHGERVNAVDAAPDRGRTILRALQARPVPSVLGDSRPFFSTPSMICASSSSIWGWMVSISGA